MAELVTKTPTEQPNSPVDAEPEGFVFQPDRFDPIAIASREKQAEAAAHEKNAREQDSIGRRANLIGAACGALALTFTSIAANAESLVPPSDDPTGFKIALLALAVGSMIGNVHSYLNLSEARISAASAGEDAKKANPTPYSSTRQKYAPAARLTLDK